jgi:hypothetical protein
MFSSFALLSETNAPQMTAMMIVIEKDVKDARFILLDSSVRQ